MNDILKWSLKVAAIAVFWVFALSIRYDGQPFFYHANQVLVQNSLVRTVDEGLEDIWERLGRAAKVAFAKSTPDDKQDL